MQSDFSGRRALVTGAASGIGAACAHWLDHAGISELILIDRDTAGLAALELGCPIRNFAGDVADTGLWREVEQACDHLDHAVIAAGIAGGKAIAQTSLLEWRRVMAANLDGAFLTLRTAMRKMGQAKQGKMGGSIAIVASVAGLKAEPGTAAYGASKAALIQLVKVAAKEGAAQNIRINAIAPGGVDTPIWDDLPFFKQLVAQHGSRAAAIDAMAQMATPLGNYASAEEIAGQIGFLLSGNTRNITGSTLISDGGYSL